MAVRTVPSRLELRWIGSPLVLVDARPLEVDTRKAIALLAYLSIRETPASREHLADLLWPESDPDHARGALRRTISSLRSGLGGRWVESDRTQLRFARDGVWMDTEVIERGGSEALDLIGGRFLEGFWLRGAPDFEEWQVSMAEHYGRAARRLLGAAVDQAIESGDPKTAVDRGEALVSLDPIDESAHRALMRAYATAGDRAAAARQFRKCVAVLETELGVDPLPETVDLLERILTGEGAPTPPELASVRKNAGATAQPPFVGRDREVEAVRSYSQNPGFLAVSGPPGSGRSRLLAEALPHALSVLAHPAESSLPHALTRSLLEMAVAAGSLDELDEGAALAGHLNQDIARTLGSPHLTDDDLGATRLKAAIALAIAGLVQDRPVIIDDFDLADDASIDTILFVAGRAGQLDLRLVLVTDRELDRRLVLGPLPEEALGALVGDSPLDHSLLLMTTGGWPGPLLEILTDPEPGHAIGRVRDRRLAALNPLAQQVLEGLAILDIPNPVLLASVTGRNADEVARAVDELVADGIVLAGDPLAVAPWAAQRVIEGMGPSRRSLLHGRAAEALAHRSDLDAAVSRAWHLGHSGQRIESAVAHAQAAERAAAIHAHDVARDHLEAAIAAGHPEPARLHRALGDVERAAGRYAPALAAYHTAASFGTDTSLERVIAEVYRRWGRLAMADATLAATEAIADSRDVPLLLADRAEIAFRSGDHDHASELIEKGLDLKASDPEIGSRLHNVAGLIRGDVEELERAVAEARRGGLVDEEAAALNNLALALLRSDRAELALDPALRALTILTRKGDRHRAAAVHSNLADIHHALGDEAKSREHLVTAVQMFAEVGIEPGGWEPEVWKLSSW